MQKLIIMISLLALLALPFASAQQQDWEHLQKLEKFNQRLKEIYSVIYDLKQQAKDNPSSEVMAKINKLGEEAEELTRQIQRMQEKAQADRTPTDDPPQRPNIKGNELAPNPPQLKTPKPLASHLQQLQGKMKQYRQELKKIQKEMRHCAPEEREYLQILRDKVLEDLKKLQHQMTKIRKPQFGPKGRNFDAKSPHRVDRKSPKSQKQAQHFQQAIEILQKEFPEEYQELMKMRQQNPREFWRRSREVVKRIQHLQHVKQKNPELYSIMKKENELNRQAKKLSGELRKASEIDEKTRAEKSLKLRGILAEIFSMRSQSRQHEIKMLQERVDSMKQLLEKRDQNKDIIIDQRLKEMIGQGQEWDW